MSFVSGEMKIINKDLILGGENEKVISSNVVIFDILCM